MADTTQETQDPTPDAAPEAAPVDETTPAMTSDTAPAEAEPTEENTAPDAMPAEEMPAEEQSADDAAPADDASMTDETAPEADPVTLPEQDGDAPAAKTEDHAADMPTDAEMDDAAMGGAADDEAGASSDVPSVQDKADALLDSSGDNAQGEGATHSGTDTPETLIQNPADPVTGKPLDGSGDPAGVIVGGSGSLNGTPDYSSGSDDMGDDDVGSLENPVFGGMANDGGDDDKASLVSSMQEALSTLMDNLDKLASLD